MKSKFEVTGMDDYFSALEKAGKDIDLVSRDALAEIATSLQSAMIANVPSVPGINTEKLKSIIKIKTPTGEGHYNYVQVGIIHDIAFTSAGMSIHANIVEFGSVRTPAHPFIRPVVRSKKAAIMNTIKARLQSAGLVD